MMRAFICVSALLLAGCAFQNTNQWTGDTKWTIGDACNDCQYSDAGYPVGGQASGSEAITAVSESETAQTEAKAKSDTAKTRARVKAGDTGKKDDDK